ncbi:MAG: ABC transporter permease, partial [Betaproteobacteria bacterium]|nr:ABC transporter permease [Betaproteobacteria bacterium]
MSTLARHDSAWRRAVANGAVRIGGGILLVLLAVALLAPWLGTVDPTLFDPASRDLRPGGLGTITTAEGETVAHVFLMGSDSYGRDLYSRVLYGTRVSLAVGVLCALLAFAIGTCIGLVAGSLRALDGLLMRAMDALMAIPSILVAIALVAIWHAQLAMVIVAIAIPEIPRIARIARSLALAIREEPYIDAAIALGTPAWRILPRHILPNLLAPLLVQASYVCASAIMVEAILSFLGVGLPPEIPSWGNIMA